MIKTKANKKFDLDLKYGEIGQDQIHNILLNSKIEVKRERPYSEGGWWDITGNICIEYECNGKPSGVNKASTESDYWFHIFCKENKSNHCMIVFEVSRLQKIVEKYKGTYTRMVGDGSRVKAIVIPITKLFESETINVETD